MIFGQIFTNALISLQWIIFYAYYSLTLYTYKSVEQMSIEYLVLIICNNVYYLNNVKPFYVSLSTSSLFRRTFVKGLMKLLPRQIYARLQLTRTSNRTLVEHVQRA